MEAEELFSLVTVLLGSIVQTLIYFYFCFSISRILKSHNNQFKENMKSLDNYLVTTLIFIGISVTTLLAMSIIDIIDGTNIEGKENIVAFHLRTLQQTIEKTAIFVDITRLSVLLIKLRTDQEKSNIYIRIVHIVLGVSITFLIVLDLLI
jgi:hypothetical protein